MARGNTHDGYSTPTARPGPQSYFCRSWLWQWSNLPQGNVHFHFINPSQTFGVKIKSGIWVNEVSIMYPYCTSCTQDTWGWRMERSLWRLTKLRLWTKINQQISFREKNTCWVGVRSEGWGAAKGRASTHTHTQNRTVLFPSFEFTALPLFNTYRVTNQVRQNLPLTLMGKLRFSKRTLY